MMKETIKDLPREQQAILTILYKNYPLPMSVKEITDAINAEGIMYMTDDEFEKYREKIYEWKQL